MVLHELVAVGAYGGRYDQRALGGRRTSQKKRDQQQKLYGLHAGFLGKHLLSLIQWQYQRWRRTVLAGVGQPIRGRGAQSDEQFIDSVRILPAGGLDLTQRDAAQVQCPPRVVDRRGQATLPGERI